ncbi:MAG: hypothetical protein WCK03_02300 [Candidatus Taylorbacteria bacterium]
MKYLHWNEKTITDFSSDYISEMYNSGYVMTRIGRGIMQQTRSFRIDLGKFDLSSENRRILNKTDGLTIIEKRLPLLDYNYSIGKLAKDFYDTKFEHGIMSAQKIKEILTNPEKSNFNLLLEYSNITIGYAICYSNTTILHYSYPFYDLSKSPKDMGLGMMLRAIQYAKDSGKKYIYLGSLQRSNDTYKLQFDGVEWFDGNNWSTDLDTLKKILLDVKL